MNNEITITLTGDKAYDYMRNESRLESAASKVQEENTELILRIDKLETEILTLQARIACLETEVPEYVYKKATSSRLDRDSKLMKDTSYIEPKKSPFTRLVTAQYTLDKEWKTFIDFNIPPEPTRTQWTEKDSAVVANAIDKTDPTYYSVDVLSTFLGRSIQSIRTRAIKTYGAHVRKSMLVSEV